MTANPNRVGPMLPVTRRGSRLDSVLAASAVAAVCVAAISVSWALTSTRPIQEYEQGEIFTPLNNVQMSSERPTLIMWISPYCRYCTESMDFYRVLTATKHEAQIVALGRETVDELRRYVAQFNVKPDQIGSVDEGSFRFRGTPTLMLVAPNGLVKAVWIGKLRDSAQQEEVLRSID